MMEEASISNDLCRLCHSKGHFRSLEGRYTHEGKELIYSVILHDTFDIVLASNPSSSICGECESRLWDAELFKKQVLDCEKQFNRVYLQDDSFKIEVKEEIDTHTEVEDFKSEENINTFPCAFSEKQFSSNSYLQPHLYTHTGGKLYMCDVCGKTFILKSDLRKHIISIHNNIKTVKPLPCDICKKSFCSKSYLIIHRRQHTGEKPYSCEVCKKDFVSQKVLRLHKNLHLENNPFTCSSCERKFVSASALKAHLMTHTGKKTFSCEICGKTFLFKGNIATHIKMHNGEKPFTCEVCKKRFRDKYSLKRHTRTHTGIKPHTCKICNKQIVNLAAHMKVHNDVRPYNCNICNKRFRKTENLKIHMRIHTGVKPYECDVCCERFSQITAMKKHRNTHDKKGKVS